MKNRIIACVRNRSVVNTLKSLLLIWWQLFLLLYKQWYTHENAFYKTWNNTKEIFKKPTLITIIVVHCTVIDKSNTLFSVKIFYFQIWHEVVFYITTESLSNETPRHQAQTASARVLWYNGANCDLDTRVCVEGLLVVFDRGALYSRIPWDNLK